MKRNFICMKLICLNAWTGTAITHLTSAHKFFIVYQFWGILLVWKFVKLLIQLTFFFPMDKELQSSDVVNVISFTSTKDKFWLTFDNLVSMTLSILFQTIGLCFPQEEEYIERPNQILSSLRQGIDDQDIRRRFFQQQ